MCPPAQPAVLLPPPPSGRLPPDGLKSDLSSRVVLLKLSLSLRLANLLLREDPPLLLGLAADPWSPTLLPNSPLLCRLLPAASGGAAAGGQLLG